MAHEAAKHGRDGVLNPRGLAFWTWVMLVRKEQNWPKPGELPF